MSQAIPAPLRPSPTQLAWQRMHRFAVFHHFGVNTFNDREWSDGTLAAATFDPTALDADQWVTAARAAGAAHVILTAKHHDGFCLWPTATTDYLVASSPWREGTGDVIAEVAAACRKQDLGLGLYLSPWDRHHPSWANDHAAYDQMYLQQLTELCSNYGELCEVWFDGAGSEQHPYDWDTIMTVVETLQPTALVFNMGRPTIRWVGNEDGLASDPCWYVVDATHKSMFDTGSDKLENARYLPPECDVAIRRHWFWHADDRQTLKSLQHLVAIWLDWSGREPAIECAARHTGPARRRRPRSTDRIWSVHAAPIPATGGSRHQPAGIHSNRDLPAHGVDRPSLAGRSH